MTTGPASSNESHQNPKLNKLDKPYDLVVSIVIYKQDPVDLLPVISDLKGVQNLNLHIVIVDNSPKPNTDFNSLPKDVEYLYSGKNLGYGRAHNLAIRKYIGQARYHLVLNPDVRIEHGTIESLLKNMDQNPSLGLTIPPAFYENGDRQYLARRLPSPLELMIRLLPLPKSIVNHFNSKYELWSFDYNRPFNVPYVSGCFMLLKSNLLKELIENESGPFDDRFFMYFEDVDLSRRMYSISNCQYLPLGKITHGYQRGSRKNAALLVAHFKSAFQYFSKWGWVFDRERTRTKKDLRTQKSTWPNEFTA